MDKSKSIEITEEMIEVGVKVLRESGKLCFASSSDDLLVREIIEAVLNPGKDSLGPKSPPSN